MNIDATFVTSAARAADFPRDGRPRVAFVGRSNVGKSSLINALVRRHVARTSAAPGKTRLANIYSVVRGGSRTAVYLVDLPGYGYARGGPGSAREFETLARAYFGRDRLEAREGREMGEEQDGRNTSARPAAPARSATIAALLLVDARHPGLQSDIEAWYWLQAVARCRAIVATKVDKLVRVERIRALRELESVFEDSVLPVSAVTGEGLDELWTLIDRLANNRSPNRQRNSRRQAPKETGRQPPKRASRPPKR